ncbi:DUF7263 family protein [Halogeometricum limi]|uniref:Uncharacterized protein n=1 Tax=Halogeometricum limi TaxID=555875 RepID=A0A1I6G2Q9_9EURY|nr:hypothetical protein [Halogeometricum limi]SFR36410.1 hypothetical protein SAMN04488124_0766 [Halogeometricum limi]
MTPNPRAGVDRAQANLLGLAAALVLLTTVATGSVVLANVALADADTDPGARHAAEAVADRLVAADANHTRRANAVSETEIRTLALTDVERLAPSVRDRDVRVRLGDDVLLERGDPDGPTVRRLVRVERYEERSVTVDLSARQRVSLPNRTSAVELDVTTNGSTTLTVVRTNDRIVLRDRSGLTGRYEFRTTRLEPPQLSFTLDDGIDGRAVVRWTVTNATVEPLEVTVDG